MRRELVFCLWAGWAACGDARPMVQFSEPDAAVPPRFDAGLWADAPPSEARVSVCGSPTFSCPGVGTTPPLPPPPGAPPPPAAPPSPLEPGGDTPSGPGPDPSPVESRGAERRD